MSKRVFITGATGFIGGRLVPVLAKHGYEVVCLVRDPGKATSLQDSGALLIKGDITERASMKEAMRGSDAVFHLAGWYAIGNHDKAKMHAINVEGARNTLELAAELGIPKILHTSTVGVFGNTYGKIVDETYRAPRQSMSSEYELTKWMAHYEVAVPLQKKGAPVTILQPGGVTGAGDISPHAITFRMFLQRMPVMMGAKSGLTLAHVNDIAEGHLLAMEKGRSGEAYILAGDALTYKQIFEICEKITGIPSTKLWAPGWAAGMSSKMVGVLEALGMNFVFPAEALATLAEYTFWGSAEKAKRELNWNPRSTEEAIKDALHFLQAIN